MIPNKINWNEQLKIRIANSNESFQKHEIVKLLYMMKYLEKHKNERNWIRIYSEWEVMEGVVSDLYIENLKTKECFAVEVQRNITEKWNELKKNQFKDWEVLGFNTADLIVIPLKDLSENLKEISKELEKYLV